MTIFYVSKKLYLATARNHKKDKVVISPAGKTAVVTRKAGRSYLLKVV